MKVFSQGQEVGDGCFYVLLSTDVKDGAQKKSYMSNTIIEEMKVYNSQPYSFTEDFFAVEEGYLGKAKVPNQQIDKNE